MTKDIIEEIKDFKNELEIKIQDYTVPSLSDASLEPPFYGQTNDNFSLYYQQKPFQKEIARIKR